MERADYSPRRRPTVAIIDTPKMQEQSGCFNLPQTPFAKSSPSHRPTFEANSAADNGSIVSIACGNVVVESEFASQYETGEVLKRLRTAGFHQTRSPACYRSTVVVREILIISPIPPL